jgi:hypothetical protein
MDNVKLCKTAYSYKVQDSRLKDLRKDGMTNFGSQKTPSRPQTELAFPFHWLQFLAEVTAKE